MGTSVIYNPMSPPFLPAWKDIEMETVMGWKIELEEESDTLHLGAIPNIQLVISGILRDKTMDDKLMYKPNDDTQNYYLFRL